MKFGSFSPGLKVPALHVLSSDDVPLYFDMNNLTPKQQADHYEMCTLVSMLQVCLMGISKPEDYIAMFGGVEAEPFKTLLHRYNAMMQQVGLTVVPMDHLIPAPVDSFYEDIAKKIPDVDIVDFLMVSRSNEVIHDNQDAIEMILKLNSKVHFAQNAPGFGIPVPESLAVVPPLTGNAEAEALFQRHNGNIMMKLDGMPGGRDVLSVSSVAEAQNILDEVYPDAAGLVLQQKLDLSHFDEWTVDLLVSDDSITLDNTRHILIHDGNWVGNHFPLRSPLTPEQEAILLNVGEYARSFGYGTAEGSNMGIDYFIGHDGEIIVTEINPRWTAGLLPSEILKRLGDTGGHADDHKIGYFDMIRVEDYKDYLAYVEKRLPGLRDASFDIMPIGFSPFEVEMGGEKMFSVWLIVRGDFAAYRNEVREIFGTSNFAGADLIPVEALTSLARQS